MNITNLSMTQATIEIFSGFVCLMMAIIILMNGHERKSWKLMNIMFFLTSGIFFSESCAYIFRGNVDQTSIFMTRCSNFIVFLLNLVLIIIFIHYMYELLQEKGANTSKVYLYIVRVCVLLAFGILISNFGTKWMYYFDDANYYHRNIGWYVYTILDLIAIFTCCVMSFRYRKAIRKTSFLALILYALTPFIAIILQAFIYTLSITNIGIFLALLLMLFTYLKEWSKTKEREEKERKSIDIIVLFIIMAISMSASVISCIESIERISENNSRNTSLSIAHMVNSSIENEFLKPIIVTETMSNDYSLKEYMIRSIEESPESVETEVATYLNSIRTGFDYPMVYVVCDETNAYYTYNGIIKFVDIENDEHDLWYKTFLEEGKHYDLEVDTDEANHWGLSVFVNTEITDGTGNFLGVCGVGVDMTTLQNFLKQYEEKYNLKITLIDKEGLIQVDTNTSRIEHEYLDNSYLGNVDSIEFYYEAGTTSSKMTKYMDDLEWYLVIEDYDPIKINVADITASSITIFVIGIIMMGIVFSVIFIRERKATKEIIERRNISITDDMTGLYNRRAYDEDCMKIQAANAVSRITMVMMDVNGLKVINDTYGHMAGDELIIGCAKCIQTSMGKHGKLYRIGGDEFVALLQCDEGQLNDMLHTFDHITANWKGSYQCELSISKGVVVCSNYSNLSFDEIKELADKLMYEDKDQYYKQTGKTRRKI